MGTERSADTFLITGAQQALDDQHRARVRRYLFMMAFRVPALVIAAIVYSSTGSGLLALAIVGISIPLPWVAVLIANDRPPRKRGEEPHYLYGAKREAANPPMLTDDRRRAGEGPIVDSETVSDSETDTGPGTGAQPEARQQDADGSGDR